MWKSRVLTIVLILSVSLVLLTVSLTFAQSSDLDWGEGEGKSAETQPPYEIATIPAAAAKRGPDGIRYCSNEVLTIKDNWPYGITGTILITDSLIISDLNIIVTATHPSVSDLSFRLHKPFTLPWIVLFDQPGIPTTPSGCTGEDISVMINDEGTDGNVEDTCNVGSPAISGNLVGGDPPDDSTLSVFDGLDTANLWALLATDHITGNTGTFDGWCMVINSTEGPDIEVDPAFMSSDQLPDVVVSQLLTISNGGTLDLDWTIEEEADAAANGAGAGRGGCSPSDIPWLSVNPASGTTPPGTSDQIDVTFDSTGMAAGLFTGSLCIESNDSFDPVMFVPVTLTVEEESNPTAVSLSDFFGGRGVAVWPMLLFFMVVWGAAVFLIRRRFLHN